MSRAVVLLSAGLDSSVNLFKAAKELEVALALTFDYGQKAARKEGERAGVLCRRLGVPHKIIELPWFREFTRTSLVGGTEIPTGKNVSIDDKERSMETMRAVWVPNRNGILLNIAAGFAEGFAAEFVVPGFNAEEAVTFPDNSPAYLEALDHAFAFSTRNGVRVKCFTTGMDKTEIVREGVGLSLPFSDLWPCYQSGDKWCGTCESCQRFRRALRAAGAEAGLEELFQ